MKSETAIAVHNIVISSIASSFGNDPRVEVSKAYPELHELIVHGIDTERLVISAGMGERENKWGISYEIEPDNTQLPVMVTHNTQEISIGSTLDLGEHIIKTIRNTIRVFLENGSVVWARSIPSHYDLRELGTGPSWENAATAALELFESSEFDTKAKFDGGYLYVDYGGGVMLRIGFIQWLGWDILVHDEPTSGGLIHYASDEPIDETDIRLEGGEKYVTGRAYALMHEFASRSPESFEDYVNDPDTSYVKTY